MPASGDVRVWWFENRAIVWVFAGIIGICFAFGFFFIREQRPDPVVTDEIVIGEVIHRYGNLGRTSTGGPYQIIFVELPDSVTAQLEVPLGFDGRPGRRVELRRLRHASGAVSFELCCD